MSDDAVFNWMFNGETSWDDLEFTDPELMWRIDEYIDSDDCDPGVRALAQLQRGERPSIFGPDGPDSSDDPYLDEEPF